MSESKSENFIMDEAAQDLSGKILAYSLEKVANGSPAMDIDPSWTISYDDLGSANLIALEAINKMIPLTPEQQLALVMFAQAATDIIHATILYRREHPLVSTEA